MTSEGSLDVRAHLEPERAVLLELLPALEPAEWERPTECPEWNVRGLALHIVGDDLSLLSRQRDGAETGLLRYAEHHPGLEFRALLDGFNEQWVTAASFLSPALIVELLHLTGEWTAAFYEGVDLDTQSGEPVGFFATHDLSPYWQVIAREYVERFVHQSQLRRALGVPELPGDLVAPAATVTVHALAAWLRETAAEPGTTVAFEFGDTCTRLVEFGEQGWIPLPEARPDATATISFAETEVVRILSRGIAPPDVRATTTIAGDPGLARAILEVGTPLLARPQP